MNEDDVVWVVEYEQGTIEDHGFIAVAETARVARFIASKCEGAIYYPVAIERTHDDN